MSKNFTSVQNIKEYAITEVAPKYFNMADTNQLNVGLLGYTTEVSASLTEDTFNTISTYIREIFPNMAQLPETIYSFAASLQISDVFATASSCPVALFVKEEDVVNRGEKQESQIRFNMDSNLKIDIEGKEFILDYDLAITARPDTTKPGEYYFNVQYLLDHENSISEVRNPYLQSKQVSIGTDKYIAFLVWARQAVRYEQIENVLNNDQISVPTYSFEYSGDLAGFDVFYKAPGSNEHIQLEKKMINSAPSSRPFCYYKINDDTRVSITFSTKDNYFRPAFNSEIVIRYYTTMGEGGNFPQYTGENITVSLESEKYEYNNGMVLFAVPQGGSKSGRNKLSLEGLRKLITEKSSTSGAYNVENDLQLFFSNYENLENNRVLFLKTRDDILERLFTAFSLYKGTDNNFYQTNTLFADFLPTEFDVEYDQSNMYILQAGHTFKYDGTSKDRVIPHTKMITDDLSNETEEYLYTNPFLMSVTKKPAITGYYLNSVNDSILVDYSEVNENSPIQFIANNITVKRNALKGENSYKVTVELTPSSPLTSPAFDAEGNYTDIIKAAMTIEDEGVEVGFVDFTYKGYDMTRDAYQFEATLTTNDYMTLSRKVQLTNIKDMLTGEVQLTLVPMIDAVINIYAFIKYEGETSPHKFSQQLSYVNHTLSNVYRSGNSPVTFILPISNMRSTVKFLQLVAGQPEYKLRLASVPLIEAKVMQDPAKFDHFLGLLYSQNIYLQSVVNTKTNNYGIDTKFYNTYGRSKHFIVGESGDILDRTNIKIHIKVFPTIGTIEEELVRDLKLFIKDYIENINNYIDGSEVNGYNGIYVSNLTQAIENTFPSVKYMKFNSINSYDSSIQVIENQGKNLEQLTKEDRRDYIPEYLTIRLEDIRIDIIRS